MYISLLLLRFLFKNFISIYVNQIQDVIIWKMNMFAALCIVNVNLLLLPHIIFFLAVTVSSGCFSVILYAALSAFLGSNGPLKIAYWLRKRWLNY